jgi:hypothetical protein
MLHQAVEGVRSLTNMVATHQLKLNFLSHFLTSQIGINAISNLFW